MPRMNHAENCGIHHRMCPSPTECQLRAELEDAEEAARVIHTEHGRACEAWAVERERLTEERDQGVADFAELRGYYQSECGVRAAAVEWKDNLLVENAQLRAALDVRVGVQQSLGQENNQLRAEVERLKHQLTLSADQERHAAGAEVAEEMDRLLGEVERLKVECTGFRLDRDEQFECGGKLEQECERLKCENAKLAQRLCAYRLCSEKFGSIIWAQCEPMGPRVTLEEVYVHDLDCARDLLTEARKLDREGEPSC